MIRNNSKGSIKIINTKIYSPNTLKTPTGICTTLNEKTATFSSPSVIKRYPNTERKTINLELKSQVRQAGLSENGSVKKIVKMRRKTQSADKMMNKDASRGGSEMTQCYSERRVKKVQTATVINHKHKCFDEINTDFSSQKTGIKNLKQTNWDQIVQMKKQQLYSQLYKMDKKIFAIQRDMNQLPNKKLMMQIIKRKTSSIKQNNDPKFFASPENTLQIHTNIYKMAKRIT